MVEELYTAFYDEVLHYCTGLTHDQAEAEDLVQETYTRALTHMEDLESLNRKQCRAWLYKTARNLYIDQLRKLSRESCAEPEQLGLASFEEDLTAVNVERMVGRLPENERAIFSLRYFAGYNATELGELFNLPPSTVRARLSAARKRLLCWYQEEL